MHNWTVTGTQLGTCTGLGGELLMWLAVASRSSPRTHNHRHSLKYNSLCNIHRLLSVMIQVSETSCYSHSTIMICTEIVYWPELDSGTLTQICFAKNTRRKPERHSCFCFWIVHLWDAWTGSQRGWRVCLEICYMDPKAQTAKWQHDQWQFSPGHQFKLSRAWILWLCCPQEWLLPLLFNNIFHPFKFKIVWLISPLYSSVMMQPSLMMRLPVLGCSWGNLQLFHGSV